MARYQPAGYFTDISAPVITDIVIILHFHAAAPHLRHHSHSRYLPGAFDITFAFYYFISIE